MVVEMTRNNAEFQSGRTPGLKLFHWSTKKLSIGAIVKPTFSLRESAISMDKAMQDGPDDDFCEHGGSHDHIDPTPLAWASPDPNYYRDNNLKGYEVEPVNAEDVVHDPHDDGTPEVASKSGFRVVQEIK